MGTCPIDSTVALMSALFLNGAILVMAGAAFHGTGHRDRARLFVRLSADVSALLHPRDVIWVRTVIIATRQLLLIELDKNPLLHRLVGKEIFFLVRAVAPEDAVGLAQRGLLVDPRAHGWVVRVAFAGGLLVHNSLLL